jgi:hypothetical protein
MMKYIRTCELMYICCWLIYCVCVGWTCGNMYIYDLVNVYALVKFDTEYLNFLAGKPL